MGLLYMREHSRNIKAFDIIIVRKNARKRKGVRLLFIIKVV